MHNKTIKKRIIKGGLGIGSIVSLKTMLDIINSDKPKIEKVQKFIKFLDSYQGYLSSKKNAELLKDKGFFIFGKRIALHLFSFKTPILYEIL